jgi:hypothetical protein
MRRTQREPHVLEQRQQQESNSALGGQHRRICRNEAQRNATGVFLSSRLDFLFVEQNVLPDNRIIPAVKV